jgi:hypothetical protein
MSRESRLNRAKHAVADAEQAAHSVLTSLRLVSDTVTLCDDVTAPRQ